MNTHVAIVLAHEEPFRIGEATVRPATRELSFRDRTVIVEPRVMQVLVALWRAGGQVISKDDLVERCWNGRIVGDDAINRVISRLRHNADEAGGAFRIETVTKVGYRLRTDGQATAGDSPAATTDIDRRGLIAGAAALAVAAAAGVGWRWGESRPAAPSPVDRLVAAAQSDMLQGSFEMEANALGKLRQAISMDPRSARAWGMMAMACMCHALKVPKAESDEYLARAKAAAKHALAIDPNNAEAEAIALLEMPMIPDWLRYDALSRRLLDRHPDNFFVNGISAGYLANAARHRDALACYDRALSVFADSPSTTFCRALTLDDMGRLAEAQESIEKAYRLWPKNTGVWFSRLYILGYGGRTAEALAMTDNPADWPVGVNLENQQMTRAQIAALADRSPAIVADAVERTMAMATKGTGFAENAMIFTGTLGLADQFFAVAEKYFFDQAILSGPRFSQEQRIYSPRLQRYTHALFRRTLGQIWRDPRFDALLTRLGLTHYWEALGITPDYRAA